MTAVLEPPQTPAAPTGSGRAGRSRVWPWLVPPLAILALIVAYPLAIVAFRTVSDEQKGWLGGSAWSRVLGDGAVWSATWTSIEIAVLATLGCVVVGTFVAIVVVLMPLPGTGLLSRWIEAVVSFPSFLVPLTFGVLFGGAGVVPAVIGGITGTTPRWSFMTEISGIVLSEVVFFTPFVAGPVIAALRRFPAAQINAAGSLGANTGVILRRVVLPEIAPAISAAGALTFLLTLNEIGIVLVTGAKSVETLPMLVYKRAIESADFPGAAVVACVEVVVSVCVYVAYRRLFRGAH